MINASPDQRREGDPSFVPNPNNWVAYTGIYTAEVDRLTIRIDGNRLLLHSLRFKQEFPCKQLDINCFACLLGLIEFQSADEGTVSLLKIGNTHTFRRGE